MKIFKNPNTSVWSVILTEDKTLRKYIPMQGFSLVNNSPITADVYLHAMYVGTAFPYGSFSINGKPYETFRIENPDGQEFYEDELVVTVTKDVSIMQTGYNPMMESFEDNLDRYANGCTKRVSLEDTFIYPAQIKYILGVEAVKMVQRRMEFAGSGALGKYSLMYNTNDTYSGSVAKDTIQTLDKTLIKRLDPHLFDYSTENCDISSWIVDYSQREYTDILDNCTLSSGHTAIYDNDILSRWFGHISGGPQYAFHATFDSTPVRHVSFVLSAQVNTAPSTMRVNLKCAGSWVEIYSQTDTNTNRNFHVDFVSGDWNDVTEISITAQNSGGSNATAIYIWEVCVEPE